MEILMDFIIAVIIFIFSLIYNISKQYSLIIPLLIGMLAFSSVAFYRGFKLRNIVVMLMKGMKKSLYILSIFALIGMITALWRAGGTIPFFVYYGIKIMNPDYFILFAFLLTCFVAFALGTCIGTAGTVGVVLIILARSGGVNIYVAAGAILSGAFFGDRSSPLSSSANLVAIITETDLYDNIKKMFITGALPFLATIVVYLLLSKNNPINVTNNELIEKFSVNFNLHISTVLPAVIILLLAISKNDVRVAMLFSIITAVFICLYIQNLSIQEILKYMIFGFVNTDPALSEIISGGGLISMLNVTFVVLIASSYSGIFEGTGMLKDIQGALIKMSNKIGVYLTTVFTSLVTCACCCNQTLSVLLTHDLMNNIYKENNLTKDNLAIDIENTAILIAAIFPWSVAVAVPLATMDVGAKAIFYAVYLFFVPLMAPLIPKSKVYNLGDGN
jgi:NhaC family Na+:H+ antiporter